MKNVGYRNAWAFLDGYRGKEFQGKWPGVNEMFHISVLRFPDHLAFHSFEPETHHGDCGVPSEHRLPGGR